jgi:hypothetical protein
LELTLIRVIGNFLKLGFPKIGCPSLKTSIKVEGCTRTNLSDIK